MHIFSTWQFNLLAYIVCAVLFNQFYKLAVHKCKHDGAATVVLQTIAGLTVLVLVPFFSITFPTDWKVYFFLALACIFYAINDRVQTTVRKNMEVSLFAISNQLSSVFLIIFGLTFFREPFSWPKIIGAGLILFANAILRFSHTKMEFNRYFWLAIFARLAFAIAVTIDVDISRHFNLPFYIMLTLIIPTLMIKTAEKIPAKEVIAEFVHGKKAFFLLTGFVWSLLIVFMIRAYQLASFTLITPLSATTVLLNVLVSTAFFGERGHFLKKAAAAALVVAGVYLTAAV